jgi:hypothetical protein
VGGVTTRAQAAAKDKVSVHEGAGWPGSGRPWIATKYEHQTTPSDAPPPRPGRPPHAQGAVKPTALKPRDPSLTAAVLRSRATSTSQKKTGSSLSSLLQSRSEAAARRASAAAAAAPLSPLPDIDSKDKHNPLAASDYAQDIYCYYRRVEPRFAVSPGYMASQVRRRRRVAGAAPRSEHICRQQQRS